MGIEPPGAEWDALEEAREEILPRVETLQRMAKSLDDDPYDDAVWGLHGGDARSLRRERREQEGGRDHDPASSSSSASPPPNPINQSSWKRHAARVLR